MAYNFLDELPFFRISNQTFSSLFESETVSSKCANILGKNNFLSRLQQLRKGDDLKQLDFDYYTESHFNKNLGKLAGDTIDLSVLHMNIRSLNSHFAGLCQYLQLLDVSFDVIVLTEIWSCNADLYCNMLPGYTFLRVLPTNSIVGGVGIYVNNCFSVREISDYVIPSSDKVKVENIWLELVNNSRKYIIGGVYRHPNRNIDEFCTAFEDTLGKISTQKTPCIVAGDFNIDLKMCEHNKPTLGYVNCLLTNDFLPTILMPTRITESTATLIDHMYYYAGVNDKRDIAIRSGNLVHDLTDHLPNYVLCVKNKVRHMSVRPLTRVFSNANIKKFKSGLQNSNWDVVYNQNNIDDAYNNFYDTVTRQFEHCFPLTRVSKSRAKDKSWITKGLRISSKRKNKLYKMWLKTGNKLDEIKYKTYRKSFSKAAAKAESLHYRHIFDNRANSVKQLWHNLNTLFSLKHNKGTKQNINKLLINNVEITDATDISNAFNRYFCTVGEQLVVKLNQLNDSGSIKHFKQYLGKPVKNSMFCQPVDHNELLKLIGNLNVSKSPGPDNFSPKLVKECTAELIEPLLHLYNLSLNSGVVPDKLKIAKVIPVYKKGESYLTSNYRPISLLSVFNKLLEKLMHARLYSFLFKNDILYQYQFGFRKNYSTILALIEVIDNIYRGLDNNEIIIGVYLDLQKAFDTVDHTILLEKLYHYGIRGTVHQWFKNYLSSRKQFTFVNNTYSDNLGISCGVPQGSVLGPLLFLIYVNDICNAAPEAKIKLFADDTNIFVHGCDLIDVMKNTNEYLRLLSSWFISNKLSLSIDKTCFTVFGPKKIRETKIQLNVHNAEIKNVKSCKYLGVLIDEDLSWTHHIEYVYDKIVKFIGIFYKLRDKVPSHCLRDIYFSFVYPHILYGIELYGCAYQSHLDKLVKLNNKLLRILQFKNKRCHVTDLYSAYNTLDVPSVYKLQLLLFVHKFIHHCELLPEVFKNYFVFNNSIHGYVTRHKDDLHLNSVKTNFGHRSVKFQGSLLWNSLPHALKQPMSISTFRTKTKCYLISSS